MGIPWLQQREEEMVRGRRWRRRGGFWQERGSKGDGAARGGGMVSAHWVWSGQVEECAFTPAASSRINGVSV